VIARARRQHVHVVPLADVLGHQPAPMLDTSGNVGTVARRDKGEFHWSSDN
jgi:hypothetical protein